MLGFAAMLVIFSSMAFLYAVDANHVLLFLVFCLIAFATNIGVSVATYVLPAGKSVYCNENDIAVC